MPTAADAIRVARNDSLLIVCIIRCDSSAVTSALVVIVNEDGQLCFDLITHHDHMKCYVFIQIAKRETASYSN
jgi:hypothetical protein